jgi:hypothetical protein
LIKKIDLLFVGVVMKNMKKIAAFVMGMALYTAVPAFSADLQNLQTQVGDFSETLAKSLPFNSALGLNWADAYIGKFFPSLPPHFGIGASAGFTTMDFEAFDKLLDQFGAYLPQALKLGQMMLPAYTVEARIGGFFLPFDVGLKFGMLPGVGSDSASMKYTLLGGEVRYAVLDGKNKLILPNVSVSAGVNYLSGQFTSKIGTEKTFDLPNSPSYADINGPTPSTSWDYTQSHPLALTQPTVGLQWESVSLDFKAQISKSFLIVTPYLGVGISHAWSSAGYTVDTTLSYDGQPLNDAVKGYINTSFLNGVEGIDFTDKGLASILEVNGWGSRAFGGLSFNLAVFRLDLTGMYNFPDGNYGVTLGTRFQL